MKSEKFSHKVHTNELTFVTFIECIMATSSVTHAPISDRRICNKTLVFCWIIFLRIPYRFFGSRRPRSSQKIHSAHPDLSVTDYRTTQSNRVWRFRLRCEVKLSIRGHFVRMYFFWPIKTFRSYSIIRNGVRFRYATNRLIESTYAMRYIIRFF